MKKKILLIPLALLLAVSLVAIGCPAPAPAPVPPPAPAPAPAPPPAPAPAPAPAPTPEWPPPKPEMIIVGDYDFGAGRYGQLAGIAKCTYDNFGIKIRVVPLGTSMARAIAAKTEITDMWGSSSAFYAAQEGVFDFATIEWGPQPMRLLYNVNKTYFFSPMVKADSGINTVADLKGKRLPYALGNPTNIMWYEAFIRFGDLTVDDVEWVEVGGYTGTLSAFLSGAVDVVSVAPGNPTILPAFISPGGAKWLQFSESDVEGWERMLKVCPFMLPMYMTDYPDWGITPDNPAAGIYYPAPNFHVWESQDEGLAYWFVKSIAESYDCYKDMDARLGPYDFPNCSGPGMQSTPYHRGVVKYFEEAGLWTDEHEEGRQALLYRQKVLIEAFEAAKIESLEREIGVKEFPGFWMEQREEALKAAGLNIW